jgi:hypothetical protein
MLPSLHCAAASSSGGHPREKISPGSIEGDDFSFFFSISFFFSNWRLGLSANRHAIRRTCTNARTIPMAVTDLSC